MPDSLLGAYICIIESNLIYLLFENVMGIYVGATKTKACLLLRGDYNFVCQNFEIGNKVYNKR